MKTNFTTTLLLAALLLAATTELSAQISGKVINFHFNRYNSAKDGAKVTVHDGENLGTMQWKGWTPAEEYQASAGISVDITGVPLAGYLPSRMSFWTGGSGLIERMTILENGNVGIGLSNPAELVDINGNVRVRGTRIYLGLPGAAGADGGEALTQTDRDCAGNPLADALTINYNGSFTGGVLVEGPGLKVCSALDAECLTAERHIVSKMGNVFALGGEAITVDCNSPGEGDFITEGANGDFIARHGNFLAQEGSVTAREDITSTQGNVSANQNVLAGQSMTAGQNVSAGNNISATNNLSAGGNLAVTGNGTVLGTMRIGTITGNPGGHRLAVGGSVVCTEVSVKLQGDWPDYVFENGYQLPALQEVEHFIVENKHLPGIPSASQLAEQGLELGQMQTKMMEKIEELYLHVIELNKKVEALETENKRLKEGKE